MIRTKIICTIGPVSESYEMLKRMAGAGMNIARLNMSHGDHEWHHKVIRHIKTLNRKSPRPSPFCSTRRVRKSAPAPSRRTSTSSRIRCSPSTPG